MFDQLIDEEPLSVRTKRLLVQKSKTSTLNPQTPPPKSKPRKSDGKGKKQPKSVRFSPAATVTTNPIRRQSASPHRKHKAASKAKTATHRPRSRTRKLVVSSSSSEKKEHIELSDTSTEYVAMPEVSLETYYRKYTRSVPRRSVRIKVNTTQTLIMKRAQKRKAASSSVTHKGSYKTKKKTKEAVCEWQPTEEVLDDIPLRIWRPGDDQLMLYHDKEATDSPPSTSPY